MDDSGAVEAAGSAMEHQPQDRGTDTGRWLCCLPCYWLRRNHSVHQASLTVATLLVTSLLVASPVLFLISSVPGSGDRSRDCQHQDDDGCGRDDARHQVCTHEQCRQASSRILASMSWKADPCQDFYKFACGGWTSERGGRPPESAFSFNTLQRHVDQQIQQMLAMASSTTPFQKLGLFYNSCLRVRDRRSTVVPMFSLLDELGGYLVPNAVDPADLTPLVSRLLLVNGAPLFDVYLDRDPHNRTRLAVFLDLPRRYGHTTRLWRHMPYRGPWFEAISPRVTRSSGKESRAYTYMKDSAEERRLLQLEALLRRFLPSDLAPDVRAREVQGVLLFASTLSKLFPREKEIFSRAHLRDTFRSYNLSQLQEVYGFVQWRPLLEHVFANNFSASDVVYVAAPEYLAGVRRLLSHFNNRVVHNALLLVYARDTLHELVNTSASADWPALCTRVTVGVFTEAVGALFVRQFAPAELRRLRAQVTAMFDRLKSTLHMRIRRLSWLDDVTRQGALRKLLALRGHFFTWPHLWNETYVARLLHDVHVDPDDFFGNVIRRYRQLRTAPPGVFELPTPENKWAYPFVVNAFYELSINSIVIPLAVLTQPYLRADVPLYVPYATVGLVFAHEMLHAFDVMGVGYTADGVPEDWFSPEARLRLEARLDCVVRQYGSSFLKQVTFLGSVVDVQFDWNVTRNENMADIGALQVAHDAWLHEGDADPRLPGINLDPGQLFFVSAAQSYCSVLTPEDYILLVEMDFHTPYPERVNGVMMNSPAFAEAFKCPVGTPMNPSKKCSTW